MKTFSEHKRKAKQTFIFLIFLLITVPTFSQVKPINERRKGTGYIPKSGFVPDDITAVKIAIAVWLPIYGNGIYQKKPYKVKLQNDVWIVEGTLPADTQGGVPYIEIQRKDGKILRVMHGK